MNLHVVLKVLVNSMGEENHRFIREVSCLDSQARAAVASITISTS